MKKKIVPLAFGYYFWPVVIIGFLGLLDSVYLSYSHYRVYADIGYKSFCAISRSLNCDTVSQSPYSILLGVPVPVWGIVGYAFFLIFLPFARSEKAEKKRTWSILFFVALAFSLYSAVLAFISTYFVHSYCIMCIASYAINLALLFYVWIIRRRFDEQGLFTGLAKDASFLWAERERAIPVFLPFFLATVLVWVVFPEYWHMSPPKLSDDAPRGVTADGHPWIGAENPEWTIVEFTDYQCFQCRKMHYFLRQLVAENAKKLRLVHRHFPMDSQFNPLVKEPYHEAAGYFALFALCAQDQGKFWEMNDLLFQLAAKKENVEVKTLADGTGLPISSLNRALRDRYLWSRLYVDVRDGLKLDIVGTPAYVIDGEVYQAQIPGEILSKMMD